MTSISQTAIKLISDAIAAYDQPYERQAYELITFPTLVAVPGTHLKHKRNVRTRQQYKRRRTLHVTVQSSVKEVEYPSQIRVEKKPRKHVILERTKLVPLDQVAMVPSYWHVAMQWDGGYTSLQPALQRFECCWHAVIRWDGTMVRRGTSGISRIGIG